PPPPDALVDCLGAWEKFLRERSLPVLVQAALMHVQFEAIHPFIDGNGRVGRLLITLFLVEREVLPAPLLYLSAFFEATRADYYERLQGVHERSEWERAEEGRGHSNARQLPRMKRLGLSLTAALLSLAAAGTAQVIMRPPGEPPPTLPRTQGQVPRQPGATDPDGPYALALRVYVTP